MAKKEKNSKPKIENFEDFENYSQMLAGKRILNDYLDLQFSLSEIKRNTTCNFPVIEPESYADGWIKYNILGADAKWKKKTFNYFMTLLCGYVHKQELSND